MSTHQGDFYEMRDRETPRLFAPSLREARAEDAKVLGLEAAVDGTKGRANRSKRAWAAAQNAPGQQEGCLLKPLGRGDDLGVQWACPPVGWWVRHLLAPRSHHDPDLVV